MRILLVEDDDAIAVPLARGLEREGFVVARVTTGGEALAAPEADLVLLDLGLPDMNGIAVCHELRARGDVPIIVISARGEEADRVVGLELGADDYLVKPFGKQELLARISAVMRRVDLAGTGRSGSGDGNTGILTAGSLTLEPARHEARVGAFALGLTPTEFRLLEALVRAGGDLVAHHRLARAGWPAEPDPDLLWLKPHLARLRSKLEAVGGPRIVAVRSVGYRIEADEPA